MIRLTRFLDEVKNLCHIAWRLVIEFLKNFVKTQLNLGVRIWSTKFLRSSMR